MTPHVFSYDPTTNVAWLKLILTFGDGRWRSPLIALKLEHKADGPNVYLWQEHADESHFSVHPDIDSRDNTGFRQITEKNGVITRDKLFEKKIPTNTNSIDFAAVIIDGGTFTLSSDPLPPRGTNPDPFVVDIGDFAVERLMSVLFQIRFATVASHIGRVNFPTEGMASILIEPLPSMPRDGLIALIDTPQKWETAFLDGLVSAAKDMQPGQIISFSLDGPPYRHLVISADRLLAHKARRSS